MANDLGIPDIGLTTLTEVSYRAEQIARVTNLPSIVDADTGFGEPMNCARTIETFENFGVSGCHIEDQVNPKRCGHLDNKDVVSASEMVKKIKSAVKARKDKNFLIIARTDANAVEGLDKTISRVKAYVDAGADMIFPETCNNVFGSVVPIPTLPEISILILSFLVFDQVQKLIPSQPFILNPSQKPSPL